MRGVAHRRSRGTSRPVERTNYPCDIIASGARSELPSPVQSRSVGTVHAGLEDGGCVRPRRWLIGATASRWRIYPDSRVRRWREKKKLCGYPFTTRATVGWAAGCVVADRRWSRQWPTGWRRGVTRRRPAADTADTAAPIYRIPPRHLLATHKRYASSVTLDAAYVSSRHISTDSVFIASLSSKRSFWYDTI